MKIVGGLLMAIGFIVTVGAIGTDDYQTQYNITNGTSFEQILLTAAVGMVVFLIGFLVLRAGERRSGYFG